MTHEVGCERDRSRRDAGVRDARVAQAGLDRSGRRNHRRTVLSAASSRRSARWRRPSASSPASELDLVRQRCAHRGAGRDLLDRALQLGALEEMVGHVGRQLAVERLLDEPAGPLFLEHRGERGLDLRRGERGPGDTLDHAVLGERAARARRSGARRAARRPSTASWERTRSPARSPLRGEPARGPVGQQRPRRDPGRERQQAHADDGSADADHGHPERDVACLRAGEGRRLRWGHALSGHS